MNLLDRNIWLNSGALAWRRRAAGPLPWHCAPHVIWVQSSWVAKEISCTHTHTHAQHTHTHAYYGHRLSLIYIERGGEIHLCRIDKTTTEQEPLSHIHPSPPPLPTPSLSLFTSKHTSPALSYGLRHNEIYTCINLKSFKVSCWFPPGQHTWMFN